MLKTIFAALALGSPLILAQAAQAQNYPWCAQYSDGGGGAQNCGFSTFAQCEADVSGIGGFCEPNNTYHPGDSSHSLHYRRR
jgi:hypothetical protein